MPTEPLAQILYLREVFLDSPYGFQLGTVAAFAGLWGSFLNMAIWRMPRRESIIFPRSHCPVCRHVLGFWDLLPIFSWLWLRGSCRYCKTHFGSRYLIVEVLLVISWSLTYHLWGLSWPGLGIALGFFFGLLFMGILKHRKLDAGIMKARRGFTFIEVLMALMIVAAIIIPFGNIFLSSYTRVIRSRDYNIGWNLVESKIAELKMIPPSRLISDWNLYVETPDYRDNIFRDAVHEEYEELKKDEAAFREQFTDIYSSKNKLPDGVHRKFVDRFESYYGFPFEMHPDGYEKFRRIVIVEEVPSKAPERFSQDGQKFHVVSNLLKITVIVTIATETLNRKLEASFYRRK